MKEMEFNGYKDYKLNVAVWDEVDNPKAVVQIMHGMVEHIARYDDFAKFLNANRYIVIGDDHRGHGKTAKRKLGVVPAGDCFRDTVEDAIAIGKYAIDTYKKPLLLFGHSYGSFLSQNYIQKAGDQLKAVVLCGSACKNTPDVKAGKLVANIQSSLFGSDKPANLIKDMSFGPFIAQFK
ncbi:MAG: lysophospholipase, partial [Clostridia bacterium]|nr:lysophospholipase [Clostridia bacterium]